MATPATNAAKSHKRSRRDAHHIAASNRTMRGIERTPLQQARANAENALRALELAPRGDSAFCPHPLDIVAAELRNTLLYLAIASGE